MEQGRLAASHMFGANATKPEYPLPYGVYTIPEISMIGKTERRLKENRREMLEFAIMLFMLIFIAFCAVILGLGFISVYGKSGSEKQ
jgi:hypothetical protein